MAAINVTQMWSKEGGSGESEKYDSFATKFSHTEGYQVLAEIGDSPEDVLSATGIPEYGARHRSGADSFVKTKTAEPMGPIFWIVNVNYEGSRFDGNVDVEWSDTTSSEPIDRDYFGRAIVTAAEEQVEGLTYELSDSICIIRRKFFTFNAYATNVYRHATNSDTFLGWPPGTARLVGYSAKNQFKFGMPLEQWDVTARIQFRVPYMGATPEQAWHKRWRHEGLYARNLVPNPNAGDPGAPPLIPGKGFHRILDINGQEVTKPVLLALDGTATVSVDNAVFIYTQLYGSLPYSALGLT